MNRNKAVFKTKTSNNRIAKTCVFMPNPEIVVIQQKVLATTDDILKGWFSIYRKIKVFKDRVLLENETVLWKESFKIVVDSVSELEKEFISIRPQRPQTGR